MRTDVQAYTVPDGVRINRVSELIEEIWYYVKLYSSTRHCDIYLSSTLTSGLD